MPKRDAWHDAVKRLADLRSMQGKPIPILYDYEIATLLVSLIDEVERLRRNVEHVLPSSPGDSAD